MAKKVLLKDENSVEILPITRGELILDSSGKQALHSDEFLATTSQPGLMSKEDKSKIDNISISTLEITDLLPNGKKIATISAGSTSYNILAPASYDWSEINNKPTNLSQFTDDVVAGKYLPLSGGTVEGLVTINTKNQNALFLKSTTDILVGFYPQSSDLICILSASVEDAKAKISMEVNRGDYQSISVKEGETSPIYRRSYVNYPILHSGNYSDYALPKDGTADSATKLATPRTIWGQSFDGTGNVSGDISLSQGKIYWMSNVNSYYIGSSYTLSDGAPNLDYAGFSGHRFVVGANSTAMVISSNGNVGIGTNTPTNKLEVNGHLLSAGLTIKSGSPLLYCKDNDGKTIATVGYEAGYGALIQNFVGGAALVIKDDNTIRTNAPITAPSFVGNLTGNADSATKVATQITSSAEHYPLLFGSYAAADAVMTTGLSSIYKNSVNKVYFIPSEGRLVAPKMSATSFIGNIDGTYVNKLTGYTKAATIADITESDSLNTALGKLELKSETTYELVKGAYDGDGTIENLAEILKVLEGIKDTETIQAIVGKYLPLTGGTISGNLDINSQTDTTIRYFRMWYYGGGRQNRGMIRVNETNVALSYYSPTDGMNYPLTIGRDGIKYGENPILHSGNYSDYALPLSGGRIRSAGYAPLIIHRTDTHRDAAIGFSNAENGLLGYIGLSGTKGGPYYSEDGSTMYSLIHSGNISDYNAGSTTKLQTARWIYGNLFDGTENIVGSERSTEFSNINATVDDPNNWANKYSLKLQSSNNAMTFMVDKTDNGRKAMIQVGHASSGYAKYLGELHLNPLGGKVLIGINGTTDPALVVNGNIAADEFYGALKGNASTATNATNASKIYISNSSVSADFPITFVSNSSEGNKSLVVSSGKSLTFNPSTGNLKATAFTGNLVGNADSATKLATSRKIWGQNFDGTANVNGSFLSTGTYGGFALYGGIRENEAVAIEVLDSNGSWKSYGITLLQNGNVAIGSVTTSEKLEVYGNVKANKFIGVLAGNASTATTLSQTTLNSGQDLNTIASEGVYTQSKTTICASLINGPEKRSNGEIRLESVNCGSNNYGFQTLYTRNTSNYEIWYRTWYGSTYTPWVKALHSGIAYIDNGTITINGTSITPITSHQNLSNYVTLNTAQTITGEKTFATNILTISNPNNGDATLKFYRGSNTAWTIVDTGGNLKFNELTSNTTRLILYETSQGGSAAFAGTISATGFYKTGSSNDYVLLGAGGHKAISDFMLKSDELTNNLTTITKTLTVTKDWMDTGIKYTDLTTGTYAVQVYVHNSADGIWYGTWSGVMSWYGSNTNGSRSDEILLHCAGHALGPHIYLRTSESLNSAGTGLRLQIAASKALTSASYTFKFKKLI